MTTTTLQFDGDRLVRKAIGSESEFLIFLNMGKFTLVQRRQMNKTRPGAHPSQRKFQTLRQVADLTLDEALRLAQEWEDAGLPEAATK